MKSKIYTKKKYPMELTNIRGPYGMKIVVWTESKPIKVKNAQR